MQETRLGRSYKAPLRNRDDVRAFCDQKGIPYSIDFDAVTQPTDETRQEFADAYAMDSLPWTDLPEKGGSTILVFEQVENQKHHGQMVSAVANRVGNNLEPGVEAMFVQASINSHYRKKNQPELVNSVNALIENQGVPVIHTSIGWNDDALSFKAGLEEQADELWKVTAFVVDSAGNEGACDVHGNFGAPYQKHNAVSHSPPLVVHVGAAARDAYGNWNVEGYSSANSPTFLGPVAPDKKALWDRSIGPEALTGTSIAAPYVSGVLAALNRRYGPYLTREQILYAVIATCNPVSSVSAAPPKTPARKSLDYTRNAAGLPYNPEYAGFGLIQPQKADTLLAQMVYLTQQNSTSITVPVEERVKINIPTIDEQPKNERGNYVYEIKMPPGIALKTTLDVEFADKYGAVSVTSPGGTALPLTMSKLPPHRNSPTDLFSMSTTHGWAGEKLEGVWHIESTTPLKQVQMNQHHFMAHDIVAGLNVSQLLTWQRPTLAHARPLTELAQEHADFWRKTQVQFSGVSVGGDAPHVQSFESIVQQLKALPSAFADRNRIYTPPIAEANTQTPAGQMQKAAELARPIKDKIQHYISAAKAYAYKGQDNEQATMLSRAADQYLNYIPTYLDAAKPHALEAAALLAQSIAIHQQGGRMYFAYFDSCTRYTALCIAQQHFKTIGDAEHSTQMLEEMRSARAQSKMLWESYLGGADAGAHRIEEGQMGYSSDERIGTDNISQNLTLIAHDPVTQKTGLVHLDSRADVKTLEKFFDGFSQNRLEVRLVGAMQEDSFTARMNLKRVMQFLATKDINIISADIMGGPAAPAALVVNPLTFALTEQVPSVPSLNADLGHAALLLARPDKPLPQQFDFTVGPEQAPILLSANVLHALRGEILNRSEAELERHFAKRNFTDRPRVVDHMLSLQEAYTKQWAALSGTLEQAIRAQGADAPNAERARVALLSQPIYVGDGAEQANAPLKEWIKDSLLVNGKAQYGAMHVVAADLNTTTFANRIQPSAITALR